MVVLSLAWPYYGLQGEAMPWLETSLIIGCVAFALAGLAKQPVWWRVIHAVFVPLAWWVSQWQIDPGWFLLAFFLLLLIYRGALSGQVPLYLSNAATVEALASVIATTPAARFVDLGAGIGSSVIPLSRQFSAAHFAGVENAPLTWLMGWLRSRGQNNLQWSYGSFWEAPLSQYDVVYAFLSPAPMPELWRKAQLEMRPGSLFISNSFPIPDLEPESIIEVDCSPPRPLYCYRV